MTQLPDQDEMHGTLILLRHGQSQANADGVFTGLLDVPLTDVGRAEAARAADLLDEAGLWASTWFCSPLLRARQTASILAARMPRPPEQIEHDWRLAERNYGALTGLNKAAVLAEHGEQAFRTWRRSVRVAPPPLLPARRAILVGAPDSLGLTESLHDVVVRVDEMWRERIEPALRARGTILVVAHGNSLRALCSVLDRLDDEEVQELNIPTGHPLLYRIDHLGHPLTRGGSYLDPAAAAAAAQTIAREGGT